MRLFKFRGRFARTTIICRLVILFAFVVTIFVLWQNSFLGKFEDVSPENEFILPVSLLKLSSVQSKQKHIEKPNYKMQDGTHQVTTHLQTANRLEPFSSSVKASKNSELDLQRYRTFVHEHNARQQVANTGMFWAALSEKSLVIVVQVHNRPDYFEYLIKSLRTARGISEALLVISHDFLSEEMNRLVKTIDFCKVMQIFFPFTIQLYPNEFPGTDPNDCPRNLPKARALESGCNNAEHPDKYGHYREAKFTMTKHHWWWKANTVFDTLNITKNYSGPVLFLEEDHFVAPDFYDALHLLYERKLNHMDCRNDQCDILSLGTYKSVSNFAAVGENLVEKITWKSAEHNMGMAFDRNMWNRIKKCSKMFCTYDDYNWDWTLMKISLYCFKNRWKALVMKAPRVFHTGECGVHHKKKMCNTKLFVSKFEDLIDRNKGKLFPSSLVLQIASNNNPSMAQPNGGWGDTRDHQLCLRFVGNT